MSSSGIPTSENGNSIGIIFYLWIKISKNLSINEEISYKKW